MARYTDADCRLCRREGAKLFLKGDRCVSKKCALERRPTVPGQHGSNKQGKMSEYGKQLREKQKVKRVYGLLERAMKQCYEDATRMKGLVGTNMLSLLERRLDNVVFRMGIASSRAQARQMVNHGLITVDGNTVNIPSFKVNVGNVIAVKESKQDAQMFKDIKGLKLVTPKWLEFDTDKLVGKINALPVREDIDLNIQEHLIVEMYSR
ncbi:MAG: 30S ribosomal protein S4 [Spirochaetales bacterium]